MAYRDRVITKARTKASGRIRVLKSRNIGNNKIINIADYDSYIDDLDGLDVAKLKSVASTTVTLTLHLN